MDTEQSPQDYAETPHGWAERWKVELDAAKKELEEFHAQGEKVIDKFRDEKRESDKTRVVALFSSNTQLVRCLLYGRTPSVSVQRRWKDPEADAARVLGVMLERMLNADCNRDGDSYSQALGYSLDDRLLPGLGVVFVRYEAKVSKGDDGVEQVAGEEAEVDYIPWKDQLWSCGSRVFGERRWWGFRKFMTKRQMRDRFLGGDEEADAHVAHLIDMAPAKGRNKDDNDGKPKPWERVEVWELWSREDNAVYWYVDGLDETLDRQEPGPREGLVQFDAFWPAPKPMSANLTTRSEVPKADYILTQDTYIEINKSQTRISGLVDRLRARAIYDKRMMNSINSVAEAMEGDLVPVENMAALSERGGLDSLIQWFPIDKFAAALQHLLAYRADQEAVYDRVTGIADIMRGQAATPGATATEQGIKAGFGSVRMQAMQDEFARFATDVQKLRVEVIAKRFSDQTIIQRSGIMQTADGQNPQLIQQAIALLRTNYRDYAIEVKPESINLTDLATLRSEKQETLTAIAGFLQIAGPLAQQFPAATEELIDLGKWALAGTRGASTAEGIFDKMAEKAKQAAAAAAANPQAAPPDPKLQAEQAKLGQIQLKGQQDIQKAQLEHSQRLVELQAEVQADNQREQSQAFWNTREAAAKHAMAPPKPEKPNGRPKP